MYIGQPIVLSTNVCYENVILSHIGSFKNTKRFSIAKLINDVIGRPVADSFLCIRQWCRWWFSDPALRWRHHSVYIWPFFGHCVNKPPNELQCHTTLLPCLQLLLNASKTKCMLFNLLLPAHARPSWITTLDGSDLEYVDNYKYLGVWLDCKLFFQIHIKHLQSKIKSRLVFLFCNKASFTHAAEHTLVTDYPTDPLLLRCHLQNSPQHSTQQIGCSLSQCHQFCHQSPIYYRPPRPVCSHWIALTTYSLTDPLELWYSEL